MNGMAEIPGTPDRTWVTADREVEITAISATAVLIQRHNGHGAFTLGTDDEGYVLVNGERNRVYEDYWLHLADTVLTGMPGWAIGRTFVVARLPEFQ